MSNVISAFFATSFTYLMTALGASCVFFFKKAHSHLLNLTLGFSSGIMLAASYFSLLKPALEQAQSLPWLVVSAGFLTGGLFIALSEKLFDSIQESLRRGDIFTKYNLKQYLVMLIGIRKEECSIVTSRIDSSFRKKCSNRNIKIQYHISSVATGVK